MQKALIDHPEKIPDEVLREYADTETAAMNELRDRRERQKAGISEETGTLYGGLGKVPTSAEQAYIEAHRELMDAPKGTPEAELKALRAKARHLEREALGDPLEKSESQYADAYAELRMKAGKPGTDRHIARQRGKEAHKRAVREYRNEIKRAAKAAESEQRRIRKWEGNQGKQYLEASRERAVEDSNSPLGYREPHQMTLDEWAEEYGAPVAEVRKRGESDHDRANDAYAEWQDWMQKAKKYDRDIPPDVKRQADGIDEVSAQGIVDASYTWKTGLDESDRTANWKPEDDEQRRKEWVAHRAKENVAELSEDDFVKLMANEGRKDMASGNAVRMITGMLREQHGMKAKDAKAKAAEIVRGLDPTRFGKQHFANTKTPELTSGVTVPHHFVGSEDVYRAAWRAVQTSAEK